MSIHLQPDDISQEENQHHPVNDKDDLLAQVSEIRHKTVDFVHTQKNSLSNGQIRSYKNCRQQSMSFFAVFLYYVTLPAIGEVDVRVRT